MLEDDQSMRTLLAVVADTHVPDRAKALHPRLIPMLRKLQPEMILHAGDISSMQVLKDLGQIAPVSIVRGKP